MPLYDLAPGTLIETDAGHLLDEDELDQARSRFAEGHKLEKIARDLRARAYSAPTPPPTRHVAVDYDQLVAMVGPEKADKLLGVTA